MNATKTKSSLTKISIQQRICTIVKTILTLCCALYIEIHRYIVREKPVCFVHNNKLPLILEITAITHEMEDVFLYRTRRDEN